MSDDTIFERKPRKAADYARLSACGFAMGCADVVPGVSGGTMAFILGIYEELIHSIRILIHPKVWRMVIRFDIRGLVEKLPWRFLTALGSGVLLAIFSLAHVLKWMLATYPELLWSFFFGLVVASVYAVSRRLPRWNPLAVFGISAGTVVAFIIVGLVPIETPNAWWFLFLSGVIAICAMILPGISGSFILVLLGKYHQVLTAVTERDIMTLAIVASGCAVGIVSFAQVLDWLFKRYHDITMAVLIGLMIGSLRKIWPWKETVRFITDRHGNPKPIEQINVMPSDNILLPLILAVVGFVVVVVLERVAHQKTEATATT